MTTEIKAPEKDWRDSVAGIVQTGKYFCLQKEKLSKQEFDNMARADFGLDGSTANKVMMIATHPILSRPENSDKLPAAWGILYELKFIPDRVLQEKLNKNELREISKYQVWDLRGVKVKNGVPQFPPSARSGSKVNERVGRNMPLTDYVRTGVAKEKEEGLSTDDAARSLGMANDTYRMIRTMVLLFEVPELTDTDRVLVQELLEKVDKTRNIRPYYRELKPLIEKVWGNFRGRALNNKGAQKRIDAFRSTIIILNDTCEKLSEIEIPYMSSEDINQSIHELANASKLIRKLAEDLRRSKDG